MGNLSVHSWADPVSGIDSVNVIKKTEGLMLRVLARE